MTDRTMSAQPTDEYAEIVDFNCKDRCKYYSEPQCINPACAFCTRYNPVKKDMFEEQK